LAAVPIAGADYVYGRLWRKVIMRSTTP